ncbi:hypothetical protein AB0953_20455 [Streptomyces sp. NPDC046866]|uniref:hypothetical protein n=1 Tax=Streptomyces sp. NPDC046866 TaxID=3154921 RepID=UPI0034556BC7
MSALHAPQRLGLGLVGALLAAGLLVAACACPEGRSGTGRRHPADAVTGRPAHPPATPGPVPRRGSEH